MLCESNKYKDTHEDYLYKRLPFQNYFGENSKQNSIATVIIRTECYFSLGAEILRNLEIFIAGFYLCM